LSDEEFNTGAVPPLPAILEVAEGKLTFIAYTQGPNPSSQQVAYANIGNEPFTLDVADNQPWLFANVDSNNIVVRVNKEGLTPGVYDGVVYMLAGSSSTVGLSQGVAVRLILLAGYAPGSEPGPDPEHPPLYLPQIGR
jgi:hypothetical protein